MSIISMTAMLENITEPVRSKDVSGHAKRNTSVASFIVLANIHHMVKYTYTVGCNCLLPSPATASSVSRKQVRGER